MGLGDDIQDFEKDATGQGGKDGDNNANKANGSNDKTEDTLVDSGSYPSLPFRPRLCLQLTSHLDILPTVNTNRTLRIFLLTCLNYRNRSIRFQGGSPSWPRSRSQQRGQRGD